MSDESSGNGNPTGSGTPTGSPSARSGGRPGKVCGAKRRDGGICQARPHANGRCSVHGGKSPAGIASPHFKTGKHSRYLKHLPKALHAAYKAALADPELTSLNGALGLLDTRLVSLLDQLSAAPAPPWEEALKAINALRDADGGEEKEAALANLEAVVRGGADAARTHERIWHDVMEVIAQRTRTSAAEAKRMNDLNCFVTVEQALTFARAFFAAAGEVVRDREVLQRLQERTLYLLPAPPGTRNHEKVVDA